jgi:hypothetical protein
MEKENSNYIAPEGHYRIISTQIKYENGEKICVFSTVKLEEEKKDINVNNNTLKK